MQWLIWGAVVGLIFAILFLVWVCCAVSSRCSRVEEFWESVRANDKPAPPQPIPPVRG